MQKEVELAFKSLRNNEYWFIRIKYIINNNLIQVESSSIEWYWK